MTPDEEKAFRKEVIAAVRKVLRIEYELGGQHVFPETQGWQRTYSRGPRIVAGLQVRKAVVSMARWKMRRIERPSEKKIIAAGGTAITACWDIYRRQLGGKNPEWQPAWKRNYRSILSYIVWPEGTPFKLHTEEGRQVAGDWLEENGQDKFASLVRRSY